MIYDDEELKRWWASLSKSRQLELLTMMIDRSHSPEFAISLSKQYERKSEFSPKQIAAIKKWDR